MIRCIGFNSKRRHKPRIFFMKFEYDKFMQNVCLIGQKAINKNDQSRVCSNNLYINYSNKLH